MKRLGHGSCRNVSRSMNFTTYIYKPNDIAKYSWNMILDLKLDPQVIN